MTSEIQTGITYFSMRAFLFILLFSLFYALVWGQNAQLAESITDSLLKKLPLKDQQSVLFSKIHAHQLTTKLSSHIDNMDYQYCLLETQLVDSSFMVTEYYFPKATHKPLSVIRNGTTLSSNSYFYEKSLNKLIQLYSPLKPLQKRSYQRNQIVYTGCIRRPKKYYKKIRKERLKKTYQMVTYIDKQNEEVKISFQIPPQMPIIRINEIRSNGF